MVKYSMATTEGESSLTQFRREPRSSDSCALQGPSYFCLGSLGLLSICFTDGLHMHDKSNVFWAYCAHVAAICPGLLGVRQPGSAIAPAGLPAIWKRPDRQPDSFPLLPIPLLLPCPPSLG